MFFFLNQKLLYVLYTRYSMQAQVQLEQPERNESPQPWELWKRTRDRGLQGQVFHFFIIWQKEIQHHSSAKGLWCLPVHWDAQI